MASTRHILQHIADNQKESMGVRQADPRPVLSPVPNQKDAGRRPLRTFGRIEIDKVIRDPKQPREEFSEEAIERLANSIREQGQLSPIRVRWEDAEQKWIIRSGERRWRATQRAGLPTIECYFHEGPLTNSEILEQQVIENCLREDLQPIEEAKAFSTLMEINAWSGKQVADALRVAPSKVSRALALLKLPNDLQDQIETGGISARAGYELSKLDNNDAQRELAHKAASKSLTHEQTASAVRQQKGKLKPKTRGTKQTFISEEGWKVVVSANRSGSYHDIRLALQQALEEVEHRLANNVQL